MEFGVPKEIRDLETRVALTPSGVLSLTRRGHTVYVERSAGAGCGFSDQEYREAGAEVVFSAAEAFGRADVVVKVTRPTSDEHVLFRQGQAIFAFHHLPVSSPDLLQALQDHEITAISYEAIEEDGQFPVLLTTSEVAGRLAPIFAGRLLMTERGGRGVLLSGIPGVPPAAVVILGGGVLGANAARAFIGTGAQVTILDRDLKKLQLLDDQFEGRVTTMLSNHHNVMRATAFADVLIGAVQTPGRRSPVIVTNEMVRSMRPGSVIIDFAISTGGCIETSRPTTLRDPIYVAEEIIHCCIPNFPALVARTGSYAINNAALPYLRNLGREGLVGMLRTTPALVKGVTYYEGKLASADLAAALGREVEIELPSGESA
jgi:alanine dehydrogenase